mgnify:CR=1 FL=1
MKSYLVDANVWLALVYDLHVHHRAAHSWFDTLAANQAFFCRHTQLALLRLLTNRKVMGRDVLGQRQAWRIFDRTASDVRVGFLAEPAGVEAEFRRLTQSSQPATHSWSDAYLAAVAVSGGLAVAALDRRFAGADGVEIHYVSVS